MTDEQVERVVAATLEQTPPDATRWSTRAMAAKTGLSRKTQTQATGRTAPVLPMVPGAPERRSRDYARHGTTAPFAALDAASGRVIGRCSRRRRSQEFRRFLERVNAEVPAGLGAHLVVDDYATHKTPAIHRRLVAHPRFHLHFAPTYSSWLNPVERWFAELTTKQLKRGVHHTVEEPEQAVHDRIEARNADPRSFVWVKTADEILDRVAPIASGPPTHDTGWTANASSKACSNASTTTRSGLRT